MKTLSIKEPWAYLIVNGFKNIENRTWKTKIKGTILIHAGKQIDRDADLHLIRTLMKDDKAYDKMFNEIYIKKNPELFGGIVGQANIIDWQDRKSTGRYHSPWFTGPVGFVLENQKPLPYFPVKGQLSFFNVDYPFKKEQ